jgi:manganese transport protein
MDPGNWATDIEGGARFGYLLIWVLLMSNLMAVLLQTLAARLGIVTGLDLAQGCRREYSRPVTVILWLLAEIAIAATDLAEALGTVVGLNLLFGLPLLWGCAITAFDTFLLLALQRLGMRKMEAFIVMLVATIGSCFLIEVYLAKPDWGGIAAGFIPHLQPSALFVAIGMIGATVMPHNLYLHSSLVQSRSIANTLTGKREACRYNLLDSAVALNAAFFVNAAILIMAAADFHRRGIEVTEIQQAHSLLDGLLGSHLAPIAFAVALLAAGQSSTITGTLSGQIVMEGFLNIRMRPWLRRLLTRSIALVPAVVSIALAGDTGLYRLLILSQVVLSLQLPFAVMPLIHFTSASDKMGSFANRQWVKTLAWITALIIVALNLKLVFDALSEWFMHSPAWVWMTARPGMGKRDCQPWPDRGGIHQPPAHRAYRGGSGAHGGRRSHPVGGHRGSPGAPGPPDAAPRGGCSGDSDSGGGKLEPTRRRGPALPRNPDPGNRGSGSPGRIQSAQRQTCRRTGQGRQGSGLRHDDHGLSWAPRAGRPGVWPDRDRGAA